ncbi:MAG: Xaa-Pro peptidase family protein [SAR324 cluster bacterium]|nr:Xaa-Pro peptidase family protein [SAR324 cluster bacterium]
MVDIPARGFPIEEFETRVERLHKLMSAKGLAGILLMNEPEVRYLSGFLTQFWQSPTRPWFLFVPADKKPIAVIPEIGAALMRTTWIDDIRTWGAPAPKDDGISLLRDLLEPLSKQGAKLGIMKGHETSLRMPLGDYERLMSGLPGIEVVDATDILRSLRMVKSAAEIEKIAHICGIASRTFERANEIFYKGQPLAEAFRSFRMECLAQGADDVPYLAGGVGQGGYCDIISPPSQRPLRSGDILMFDTGATFDGYFCDFDRNFAFDQADELSRRAYDTLWRATEAGLAAARPGTTCRELFQAMQNVISESEPYVDEQGGEVGRYGHGLGMQLTEWPSHAAFDDTVLEENMVITLEPSLNYGDGQIMVHEENIVVQNGAPRLLSERATRELPVIVGN